MAFNIDSSPRYAAGEPSAAFVVEQPREDRSQRPQPLTDFYGEDHHELVQKLAYQHWEKRGSPPGSPEIDWFAAEKTMRDYLLASEVELGPDEDLYF
jgi:hypothetical protein